ncbi:MAG: MFS transporter [Candidatus Dormibacteraceae bacterium]
MSPLPPERRGPPRTLLTLAASGLLLAAIDAYAVVALLPAMMGDVGVSVDRIEQATPILTGFLAGYVVAMPLVGAVSDVRGRVPVYLACLALFAAGSAVTAASPSLAVMAGGRVLQGLGGGALVPLTLALAADVYPAGGRPLALGAVSGLQEAGSAVGPLWGAALAAAAAGWGGWRCVFWLNLVLALALAVAIGLTARWPLRGGGEMPLRAHRGAADVPGAALLGAGLGLLVLALYPDDPSRRALHTHLIPILAGSFICLAGYGWRQARRLEPLIPRALLGSAPFLGSLGANLLAGVALMVALVDVPLAARGVYGLDQLGAALLLARFLAGVPVGALLGGWLAGRVRPGPGPVAAAGLLLAGAGFAVMSGWGPDELPGHWPGASASLFAGGLGLGLVIAPLATAALDVRGREHGLAASLLVMARTLGMLVGLAGLTAFGLQRFQAILAERRGVGCSSSNLAGQLACLAGRARSALLIEYQELFLIAAATCLLGALVAALTLRGARPGLAGTGPQGAADLEDSARG